MIKVLIGMQPRQVGRAWTVSNAYRRRVASCRRPSGLLASYAQAHRGRTSRRLYCHKGVSPDTARGHEVSGVVVMLLDTRPAPAGSPSVLYLAGAATRVELSLCGCFGRSAGSPSGIGVNPVVCLSRRSSFTPGEVPGPHPRNSGTCSSTMFTGNNWSPERERGI